MLKKTAVLIMAAGQASRFGACKALAEWQDKPLLQHVIETTNRLPDADRFVVSGAWHRDLLEAQQQSLWRGAELIYHQDWADGLGSSIAKGVAHISDHYAAVFILLADQIGILPEHLLQMYRLYNGQSPVCAYYAGRRGVPALFSRQQFPDLQKLKGDKGAKALLYREAFRVQEYTVPAAAWDIDTPEQLKSPPPSCVS